MSIRPEKAQSNRLLLTVRSVRTNEIQLAEKGLYFFQREKCWAQGTRTEMNSSAIPCPFRNKARPALTRSVIRADGKLRRRFFRKGITITRSPRFQYSTTRMFLGGAAPPSLARGDGSSGKNNRSACSKARTSRHFQGSILNRLARAAASDCGTPFTLESDPATIYIPSVQQVQNLHKSLVSSKSVHRNQRPPRQFRCRNGLTKGTAMDLGNPGHRPDTPPSF